jgi:hypothetical protein
VNSTHFLIRAEPVPSTLNIFNSLSNYAKLSHSMRVASAFVLVFVGVAGCAEGPAANHKTEHEIVDPKTPYGALNLYCQSIEEGDIATASGLIDAGSVDPSYRQLRAQELITDAQFFWTAESHYGSEAAVKICEAYRLQIRVPVRQFTLHDFSFSNDGNVAAGWVDANEDTAEAAPLMRRGPDGIWRIWSPTELRFQSPITMQFTQEDIDIKKKLIGAINTGQYASAEDLVQAIPAPHPQPALRSFNARPQDSPASNLDGTTIRGAIGAYYQAFMHRDEPGIARFFYVDDDPDGVVVKARAARVISTLRLKDAIDKQFNVKDGEDGAVLAVGLDGIDHHPGMGDQPWWGDPEKIHGDRATLVFEDVEVPLRRVGGFWKMDITPSNPQTPADLARSLEHDANVLNQMREAVLRGKYPTARDVYEDMLSRLPENGTAN